jgi:HPt (histidine-containing phosphotransfer) domain-containing protein
MLFRLSRILFWMAAAAAVTALAGPPDLATVLTALAGIALLVAYGLARWALLRERGAAVVEREADAPALLDASALAEIAQRVEAAVVAAPGGLEPAALAAAAVLRAELGAREITVHRVRQLGPPFVDLVTLGVDGRPGIEHRVRLERSPLGVALRDSRVALGEGGGWAIPLRGAEGGAAAIELGPLALQAAPGALETLFAAAGRAVCGESLARDCAAAASGGGTRDILTPGEASSATLSWAQGGGCRRQYLETAVTPEPLLACAVSDLPTRPTAPAVLDVQALERLRELDPKGENKLVERVLRAFETSVMRLLPQLEAARANGDRAGVRHVAHTLKSSSASIGALQLSQHCAAVEALIREERPDDLEPLLAALVAELASVRLAIQAMLNSVP